jgi:hypothetical protein
VTDEAAPPDESGKQQGDDPTGRYVDVEALAFAIVRALDDRDNGLIAEVEALKRQVTAIEQRQVSPVLDASALEAVIEHQPDLRWELNGMMEQLLDSARSDSPAAPTTTALLLITLPLTQSLTRRHNELKVQIDALRQELALLCEEVANLNHAIVQDQGRQRTSSADLDAIQRAVRLEVAPLRQNSSMLDRAVAQQNGAAVLVQDALRTELARLIERLNVQSRTEQVVALREEVRAQLGSQGQADEIRSLRTMIETTLSHLRASLNGDAGVRPQAAANGHAYG